MAMYVFDNTFEGNGDTFWNECYSKNKNIFTLAQTCEKSWNIIIVGFVISNKNKVKKKIYCIFKNESENFLI